MTPPVKPLTADEIEALRAQCAILPDNPNYKRDERRYLATVDALQARQAGGVEKSHWLESAAIARAAIGQDWLDGSTFADACRFIAGQFDHLAEQALLPAPVGQAADAGALAPAWRPRSSWTESDGEVLVAELGETNDGEGNKWVYRNAEYVREYDQWYADATTIVYPIWFQPLPAPPSPSPRAAELDTPKASTAISEDDFDAMCRADMQAMAHEDLKPGGIVDQLTAISPASTAEEGEKL